jgi:transposase InsO family protein
MALGQIHPNAAGASSSQRLPQVLRQSLECKQFTSGDFIDELVARGVRISMDGKGRFLDNIFIERLWRSLKYEEVFIKAYASVGEARGGISRWRPFTTMCVSTRRSVIERHATCSRLRRPVDMWTTQAR